MICQPCRSAGQYLNAIKRSRASREDLARSEHARCKGGTWCDCQHKTEPYRPARRTRNYAPVSLENRPDLPRTSETCEKPL